MTFSSTITRRMSFEDRRLNYGSYTSDGGSVGGELTTGLRKIDFIILMPKGSATTNQPVINEIMPCDDPVTIVTAANEAGIWIAVGLGQ